MPTFLRKWRLGISNLLGKYCFDLINNKINRKNKEHIFWVHGLKSKILGFFHLQYEISIRQSTIMLYVRNLGLLPDAGCRMMTSMGQCSIGLQRPQN
jgi:hypothetical protein